MRVKELADLAGTTVRTVRYYHQVGLLPVPPSRGGVREYDLFHLARLLRIRWLVESGLPLTAIGEVLTEPGTPAPPNAAEELRQALASVDARIARLRAQRRDLVRLLASAERGKRLTPLSERVAGLYDRIAALMPSGSARQGVEIERSVMVFLAVHGLLPSSLDSLVADLDSDDDADTVALFKGLAALADATGTQADRILESLLITSGSMLDRHASAVVRLAADLPRGFAGVATWATVRRLARMGFPAPAQQRFIDLLADQFLADPRIAEAFHPRGPDRRLDLRVFP